MKEVTAWPSKAGEFVNGVMDSTRWNGFEFREGDVVVSTYPKSGTTLTQQIVAQLLFGPDPDLYGAANAVSPWIDFRHTPAAREIAQEQPGRRVLKTHLPAESMVISPKARYLFVARDPRDVAWSFHNHLTGFTPEFQLELDAAADHAAAPLGEVRSYYHDFLDGPGQQQPFWGHLQGWWDLRTLPNLMLVHYADIIADREGQIRRIADFIEVPVDAARAAEISRYCTVEHMRRVASPDPFLNFVFRQGSTTFINKGVNGRWREVLSAAEITKAEMIARRELSRDCADWLLR